MLAAIYKRKRQDKNKANPHSSVRRRPMLYALAVALSLGSSSVTAQTDCSVYAPPAVVKGKKIFDSLTGTYLPIKGINYYPRPNAGELVQTNSIDFFIEDYRAVWERDIANFQRLNINVVRIYAVSPGQNHDGFMCALKSAGIYAIIGLAADCENCAIGTEAAPSCYSAELKSRGQFIISEFARYQNVLAFSAGNEVSLAAASAESNGPCQKQFIRDMRAFVQSCNDTVRPIPVGLEIADVDRAKQTLWYACRSDTTDELENAEFIGINAYLHCDGSATSIEQLVGFEQLLIDFSGFALDVPVIISEFGCVDPSFPTIDGFDAQRNFLQVDAIFSERYREQFVGGVVFEYNTELINSQSPYPFTTFGAGNYGVGYFQPENCDDIDVPCVYVPFPQFDTLAAKYAAVDTNSEPSLSAYAAVQSTVQCPAEFSPLSSFEWTAAATEDLACPGLVYVTCPGVPTECTNLGVPLVPREPTTTTPATSPSSTIPTVSSVPSVLSTKEPSRGATNDTDKSPSAMEVAVPTKTPNDGALSVFTTSVPTPFVRNESAPFSLMDDTPTRAPSTSMAYPDNARCGLLFTLLGILVLGFLNI